MNERTATCSCGQLRITLLGEPERISMCHCGECQRRTGSVFGVGAYYDKAKIKLKEGQSTRYTRGSDSGMKLTFDFCPRCGTTLNWENERTPNLVGVAVGAFSDQTFPAPLVSVWTERKHHWVPIPSDLSVHQKSSLQKKSSAP